MPKSEILFFFEIFFIVGVAFTSIFYIWKINFYFVFLSFLVYLLVFAIKGRYHKILFIFLTSSFILGSLYSGFYFRLTESNNIFLKHRGEVFAGKLKIVSEPREFRYYQMFFAKNFGGDKTIVLAPQDLSLNYGDIVSLEGKIVLLNPNHYFKENIFTEIKPNRIKVIQKNKGNKLVSLLYKIKNSLKEKINIFFNPSEASFYNGLLFGGKEKMPKSLIEKLKKSGTIHLIALSGYNISIISIYFLSFFIFLGLNRQNAFYFAVLGIFLFVLMTGASKSCLRAAIMGSLYLLAQKIGSLPTPKYILSLTGFLMVAFNPKILFFDIGFQLSFLATIGLFYFFEPIKKKTFLFLSNKFKKIYFSWQDLPLLNEFFITISAQFAVAPLLIFYFGYLPIGGIISNVFILPFIPIVMLFAFIVAILGFINNHLAFIFSLFLKPFWSYFNFLINITSKTGFKAGNFMAKISFFIFYFIALYFILKNNYRTNEKEI